MQRTKADEVLNKKGDAEWSAPPFSFPPMTV